MSKGEDVKKKIQAAIDMVKDFEEPYKTIAFKVILTESLEKLPREHLTKGAEKEGKSLSNKERIKRFAESMKLSVAQLANVFDFSEDTLRFIAPLTGSIQQKQIIFTQCVLIALEQVYKKRSIKAIELTEMLDYYGLSASNLARSLKNCSDIFRKIGKKRNTLYKLTDVGKNSAIELVHSLATVGTQS